MITIITVDITVVLIVAGVAIFGMGMSLGEFFSYVADHSIQIALVFWAITLIAAIISFFVSKDKFKNLMTTIPLALTSPAVFIFPLSLLASVVEAFEGSFISAIMGLPLILLVGIILWTIIIMCCVVASWGFGIFLDDLDEERPIAIILIETIIALIIQIIIL